MITYAVQVFTAKDEYSLQDQINSYLEERSIYMAKKDVKFAVVGTSIHVDNSGTYLAMVSMSFDGWY